MKELKFAKSVADAMADEIREARWKVLKKISIEEAYTLMRLREDIIDQGNLSWYESLANRYERGQHHLAEHLEIEDPTVEKEIAQGIAEDMRELKNMAMETMGEPVTEERLREAEEICRKGGVKLDLVDSRKISVEISPN